MVSRIGNYWKSCLEQRDMGVKAMKGYSTFPKATELEPDQMIKCHIKNTRWRDLLLYRDTFRAFYCPSRLCLVFYIYIYIYIYMCVCVCVCVGGACAHVCVCVCVCNLL